MEYDFNLEESLFENAIRAVSGISKATESNFLESSGGFLRSKSKFSSVKVRQSELIKEKMSKRIIFSDLRSEFSKNKLFDPSEKNLICDPIYLYSNGYSLCMYNGVFCKSMFIRKVDKLPKRYVCKGSKDAVFEIHYRYIDGSKSEYIRGVFGYNGHNINKAFTDMSSFKQTNYLLNNRYDNENFVLTTSMFDDLADQWITEITLNDQSIIIGSNRDGVNKLSKLREEPLTITGRKKAIMHWVAEHTRLTKSGYSDISTHTRGIDSFNIDDFSIRISPPALSLLDHKHPEKFKGTLSFDIFNSFRKDALISYKSQGGNN